MYSKWPVEYKIYQTKKVLENKAYLHNYPRALRKVSLD